MYKSYLKLDRSRGGFGVFTSIIIPARVPVLEFKGDILTSEEIGKRGDKGQLRNDIYLQIEKDIFLGPSGEIDDYVNHSCNPNCSIHTVGRRAFLYSIYVIPANHEINFDYSTSSTDDLNTWRMQCNCGCFNCRKIISGFQYLDKDIQDEYRRRDILPLFIKNTFK
jgi:hypothetical protein